MANRQLAGIGVLCLMVLAGVARADLVLIGGDIIEIGERPSANQDAIRDLAVSPDGKILACAGRGGFYFFDAELGKRLSGLPGKVDYGTGVRFSPDGQSLYTADAAGNLLRWDFAKRTVAFRFPQVHSSVEGIALSADGTTLVTTDGMHAVSWQAQTGRFIHSWKPPTRESNSNNPHRRLNYIYDGYVTANSSPAARTVRYFLALSPDGRRCAGGQTGAPFSVRATDMDFTAHTWPQDSVASIDIAPDGSSYAIASPGGAIQIAQRGSLRPSAALRGPQGDCQVRFAPDGKALIAFDPDAGVLAALDVASGKTRWQHQQAPAWITTAVAFISPKLLATGDSDRRIRIYDLHNGKIVRTIELPRLPPANSEAAPKAAPSLRSWRDLLALTRLAPPPPTDSPHVQRRLSTPHFWYPALPRAGIFLKDNTELLVFPAQAAPLVYDLKTGQPIRKLNAFFEKVNSTIAINQIVPGAERRRLFVSSGQQLLVWDMLKDRIEHEFQFPSYIVTFAVAPDGKRIAAAGGAEIGCPQPIFVASTETADIVALEGHQVPVAHLAFSADSARLFSASVPYTVGAEPNRTAFPGLIVEWDLHTGKSVRTRTHSAFLFACTADAKTWAVPESQGGCRLIDWPTQKVLAEIGALDLRSEDPRQASFAFTPDGTGLVTGEVNMLRLWDARTGKLVRQFAGHIEQGTAILCFSDDGRLLATTEITRSDIGSLRLWDVAAGKEIHVNPGHRGPIRRVAYSPDGRFIVSAGEDRRILWWDARNGKMLGESGPAEMTEPAGKKADDEPGMKGHRWPIRDLCFSADGSTLASDSAEKIVVWDTRSRRQIGRAIDDRDVRAFTLSPDGKKLLAFHEVGQVKTWETATGKLRSEFSVGGRDADGDRYHFSQSAFSPDGSHLAAYRVGTTEILVFSVSQKKMVRCLGISLPRGPDTEERTPPCIGLAFSADGRYVAASVQDSPLIDRWHGRGESPRTSIHVWELAGGKKTAVVRDVAGAISAIAFSPDGRSLLHALPGSAARISNYYYKGDEVLIASGGESNGGMVMRDLTAGNEFTQFTGTGPACVCTTTGRDLPILPGGVGGIRGVAIAPDGQLAVTIAEDRTLLVWNARAFAPTPAGPIKLSAAERASAWADLADADSAIALRAIVKLAGDPDGTPAFLKSRLTLMVPPTAARLQQLIAALGSNVFSARIAALRELEQYRELAEPALQEALPGARDPERRRALETLLAKCGDDQLPDVLREHRAVEVLEKIASRAARAHLAELAQGPAHARLTRQAAAALLRLRVRGS